VYCFEGSCEVSNLDVIDFIMQMDKSNKHEAIVKAKNLVGNASATTPAQKPTLKNTAAIDFKNYVTALNVGRRNASA